VLPTFFIMGGCCKCCKGKVEGDKPVYIKRGDRKCTDCLFCLLFLVFWVGMVAIAGIGIGGGEPDRLLYGVDYEVCCRDCGDAPVGCAGGRAFALLNACRERAKRCVALPCVHWSH